MHSSRTRARRRLCAPLRDDYDLIVWIMGSSSTGLGNARAYLDSETGATLREPSVVDPYDPGGIPAVGHAVIDQLADYPAGTATGAGPVLEYASPEASLRQWPSLVDMDQRVPLSDLLPHVIARSNHIHHPRSWATRSVLRSARPPWRSSYNSPCATSSSGPGRSTWSRRACATGSTFERRSSTPLQMKPTCVA
jgi:hypothetical protein